MFVVLQQIAQVRFWEVDMMSKQVENLRSGDVLLVGEVAVVVKKHGAGGSHFYPGIFWRDSKTGTEGWSSYHILREHGKWCGNKTGWLSFEQVD